jgi:hypothetical protein
MDRFCAVATLWSGVQALWNQSGVTQELRDKLWAECAANSNKLCNVISGNDGLSPSEKFYGKAASNGRILRVFCKSWNKI